MRQTTYAEIDLLIGILASKIDRSLYDGVFGVPRGGVPICMSIAQRLNLPVVSVPSSKTLVVDDICDSGTTLARFEENDSAVLFSRDATKDKPTYVGEVSEEWIQFPWESGEQPGEDAIIRLLQVIGEDPKREGLLDTPKRVLKSYKELFAGYKQSAKEVLGTTFDSSGYDQIVILKDIEMYSTCEHHMIPFVGTVSIGYLPNKRVVGLSKLARLVEVFSRRLQIQEKMTQQIADAISEILESRGTMVVVKAKHFCMCARGVNKQNSWMITSAIRGRFEEPIIRQEFLSLIGTP